MGRTGGPWSEDEQDDCELAGEPPRNAWHVADLL
jgi:hypothetical protein